MPGQEITAGTPVKVAATIGGAPISGKVRVAYPASAYGYSSEDIQALMMQQLFLQMFMAYYGGETGNSQMAQVGGMMFVPPNNIVLEFPASNGVAIVPLPEKTSGYVTVTFLTKGGEVAGQYTFKVNPKTPLGGYEPYIVVALLIALIVVVLVKRGVISIPDKLKVRFSGVRDRLKKGSAELPDLD